MKNNLDFNNQKWVFRPSRLKHWGRFVKEEHKRGLILVAGLGEFEKALASNATFGKVNGDYNNNYTWNVEDAPVVYCFEVLEHLLNPGKFLKDLAFMADLHAAIYVSFPTGRPISLWTNGHFHEFQVKRAEKMFEMCGLEIVRSTKTPIIWMKWWKYFTGFRPLLRLFFPLRCAIYELRRKQ